MAYARRCDLFVGMYYKISGDLGRGIATIRTDDIAMIKEVGYSGDEICVRVTGVTFEGKQCSEGWHVGDKAKFERVATRTITDDFGFEYVEGHPLNDIVESMMRGTYE